MANAAQAELMKRKTAEEAAAIASLVAGFEAAAISNVGHQTDLRTQLETAEANLAALAKAKDYMLAGNSSWPLKKLIGIPVPKDIKGSQAGRSAGRLDSTGCGLCCLIKASALKAVHVTAFYNASERHV